MLLLGFSNLTQSPDGGEGDDTLLLDATFLTGSEDANFTNFETLRKTGAQLWILSGTSTFKDVEVHGGTLLNGAGGSLTAQSFSLASGTTYQNDEVSSGDVIGDGGANTFFNNGGHTGDVNLGAGNDTLFDWGGLIGQVDLGSGDDLLNLSENAGVANARNFLGNEVGGGEGTDHVVLQGNSPDAREDANFTGFEVLSKDGAGTWTLSGSSSFDTATVISGRLVNGASVTASEDTDFTNFETLEKRGAGAWTLSGTSSFTSVDVNEGLLVNAAGGRLTASDGTAVGQGAAFANDGTHLGAAVVALGGTLMGNGRFKGPVTVNRTLRPGRSIGTLTFAQGVTLRNGSTTVIELDASANGGAGAADALAITGGSVEIEGGRLGVEVTHLALFDAVRVDQTHKVIDGTSQGGEVIEGTFSSTLLGLPETVSSAFIIFETIYGPDSVEIRIQETNGSDLIGAARSDNQRAVAEQIGTDFNSSAEAAGALLPALAPFALAHDATLRAFLDRQAPLQGGAIQQGTAMALGQVLDRANGRLGQLGAAPGALTSLSPQAFAQASRQSARSDQNRAAGADQAQATGPATTSEERFGVWLEGLGAQSDVGGDDNAEGFDSTAWGVVGGIDYRISETIALGLFGGYTQFDADFDGSARDDATSDQTYGGIHGGWSAGALSLRAAVGYARLENETARDTGTGSIAEAEFDGEAWFGVIEGGYLFEFGRSPRAWRIGPNLALRAAHVDNDSRRESGGGILSQRVNDEGYTSLLGEAGALVARDFSLGGARVTPYGSLALSYEFADTHTTATGGFANVPGAGRFQVDGPEVDRAAVRVGLGAVATPGGSWPLSVSLDYDGRYNQDIVDQALTVGLRLEF